MADSKTPTGLSEEVAQEFHALFVKSTMMYVIVAVVAHILVWIWRPWFPGVGGYETSLLETGSDLALLASAFV